MEMLLPGMEPGPDQILSEYIFNKTGGWCIASILGSEWPLAFFFRPENNLSDITYKGRNGFQLIKGIGNCSFTDMILGK
jgi:hypothetical protein